MPWWPMPWAIWRKAATANVFLVKDGVVFTPIPNGTFLAGITRARHIANLRADGFEVRETVLTFEDAHAADEIFLSGNFAKVTAVKALMPPNIRTAPSPPARGGFIGTGPQPQR